MTIIRVLDPQTANSIAAGEVVERPASVIKELVENALDAGASTVSVEISGGGILAMAVNDNGRGMEPDDARLAFERHATSKIRTIEDLDTIGTLGFRGEALASIAAVSRISLRTRQAGSAEGFEIRIDGGRLVHEGPAGTPQGTTIRVEQLFYNTPARFKFLKKDSSEAAAIAETMERLVLSRPDVSFRLVNDGQEALHSPGNNDLLSAIYSVYGRKQAALCIPVAGQNGPVKVGGYVARPEGARGNRGGQTVLVNGRIIRAKAVTAALDEAFKTRLMKGRFAFAVLRLELPPELVDVNVHPQKLEVRFWKDHEVFSAVYQAVVSALNEHAGVPVEREEGQPETGLAPIAAVGSAMPIGSVSGHARPLPVQAERSLGDMLAERAVESLAQHQTQPQAQSPAQPLGRAWPDQPYPADIPQPDRYELPQGVGLPVREAAPAEWAAVSSQSTDVGAMAFPGTAGRSASHSDQSLLKAADLSQGRVIGQLFQTYILIEWQDELILIDQHAAHEKILYERLRLAWNRKQGPGVQPLLVPLTMTVTSAERILFEAEQDFFSRLGFSLDVFGSNGLIIRSLPDLDSVRIDAELAVRTALQALQSLRRSEAGGAAPAAIDEMLYQMACKAAVKAHDRLTSTEIERLVSDLAPLDNPYTCPHGRPVIIRMPRLELEKKFKRVL